MNSITSTAGGFDAVVFESVIDTLAGGTTLDISSYTNSDGVIPAGLPVGFKNGTTGLSPIITNSSGTLSGAVLGYVHHNVPLVAGGNAHVGVVIAGVLRAAAMPTGYSGAGVTSLKAAQTKVTIV